MSRKASPSDDGVSQTSACEFVLRATLLSVQWAWFLGIIESLIQEALWSLLAGRTAVVIAHRLSTVRRMDRLIVLERGRIAEDGTHDQLLQRAGIYASLWAQ